MNTLRLENMADSLYKRQQPNQACYIILNVWELNNQE